MATANTTDDVKIQDLKVTDGATATTTTTEKPVKQAKPKKEKVKQEKPAAPAAAAAAAAEAPAEELDFNRSPEEVAKALDQLTQASVTYNRPQPDVKM